MPEPSCAPPASLMLWAAALLAGVGLLLVVALALESARWRVTRGALALRLLGALLAVALAGWSLLVFSQLQALYDTLAAKNEWNPDYCLIGGVHGPDIYPYWLRMTAAQIAPYQRAALITTSATIAFVLVIVLFAAWRRLRNRRHEGQPRMRMMWSGERGRAVSLILLLALIVASLGEFAVIQVQSAMAQAALNAPCPSTMTAADVQDLSGAGIALIPSQDTMPVSAQTARTTSRQGLGDQLPTNGICIAPALFFVDHSTQYVAPRFAILWVVGYRIPASTPGPDSLATPPGVQWTFVDAQSGQYDGNIFISVVGG